MVRVLTDFWRNVQTHDALIKRCFYHCYHRWPDWDKPEALYHELLLFFSTINIFEKFNAKLARAHDSAKSFELFVYTWCQSFMSHRYLRQSLYYSRYKCRDDKVLSSFNPHNAEDWAFRQRRSVWSFEKPFKVVDSLKVAEREKFRKKKRNSRKLRTHLPPTYLQYSSYLPDHTRYDEETEVNDLISRMNDCLDEREKRAFEMSLDGSDRKTIRESTNMSRSDLRKVFRKLRERYQSLCA